MRAAIYQPQYFPRLHYFNRILESDVFVVLDSAQYVKSLKHDDGRRHRSYQSDAPIKTDKGELLLTVPVKHQEHTPINEAEPQYGEKWQRKHLAVIRNAYARAPFLNQYWDDLLEIIMATYSSLADLNLTTILWGIARLLEDKTPVGQISLNHTNTILNQSGQIRLKQIIRDSDTDVRRPEGRQKGAEWTAGLCLALKADEYIYGGTAASGYMEMGYYRAQGIKLVQQDWKLRPYTQQYESRSGFIPNLSIIDLLLNSGPEEALIRLMPAVVAGDYA